MLDVNGVKQGMMYLIIIQLSKDGLQEMEKGLGIDEETPTACISYKKKFIKK